jgi:hypothetical protein
MTVLPVDGSNSLADLAARIKAEHEASALAVKRGLAHAINAGRLLIEAKDQLAHGQWLPWLREHCAVPERSAQRYMHLATYAAETESANLADFASDDDAASISIAKAAEAGELMLVAQLMLDGPFCAMDFDCEDSEWLRTKLMHQLKVPAIADWCFAVAESTKDGRPALRLCPWDELLETVKVLAPVATPKGKHPIKFDSSFENMEQMIRAISELQHWAMWMLGGILNELKYRDQIGDDRYHREWTETRQHVMARLDAKVAQIARAEAPP